MRTKRSEGSVRHLSGSCVWPLSLKNDLGGKGGFVTVLAILVSPRVWDERQTQDKKGFV